MIAESKKVVMKEKVCVWQGLGIGSVCRVHGAWYVCLAGSFLQAVMDKEERAI